MFSAEHFRSRQTLLLRFTRKWPTRKSRVKIGFRNSRRIIIIIGIGFLREISIWQTLVRSTTREFRDRARKLWCIYFGTCFEHQREFLLNIKTFEILKLREVGRPNNVGIIYLFFFTRFFTCVNIRHTSMSTTRS